MSKKCKKLYGHKLFTMVKTKSWWEEYANHLYRTGQISHKREVYSDLIRIK